MLEYKVDASSNDNLVPVNMFKLLFPRTKMTKLADCKNTNLILCAYNNLCFPQLGLFWVRIAHKDRGKPFILFVVPGWG